MILDLLQLDKVFREEMIETFHDRQEYISLTYSEDCGEPSCIEYPIRKSYFFTDENGNTLLVVPFIFTSRDSIIKYFIIEYHTVNDTYEIRLYLHLENVLSMNSVGRIYLIKENEETGSMNGKVDIMNFLGAKREMERLGFFNQLSRPREVIMALHSLSYLMGVNHLELVDMAITPCSSGEGNILVSFSRKLAGLSYYYQQFGYQIKEDSLPLFISTENAYSRLRTLPVKIFFFVLNIDFRLDVTVGEYFTEFHRRNPQIPCSTTTQLLNLMFYQKNYFLNNEWNIEMSEIMNPILTFFSAEERFFYNTSYDDLRVIVES